MFCRKCGNNLADDSVFCAKCGTKVEEVNQVAPQNASEQVVVQEVAPVEMPQPVPQQVVAQELPPVAPTEMSQPVPQQTTYNQKATSNNKFSNKLAGAIKLIKVIFTVLFVLVVVFFIGIFFITDESIPVTTDTSVSSSQSSSSSSSKSSSSSSSKPSSSSSSKPSSSSSSKPSSSSSSKPSSSSSSKPSNSSSSKPSSSSKVEETKKYDLKQSEVALQEITDTSVVTYETGTEFVMSAFRNCTAVYEFNDYITIGAVSQSNLRKGTPKTIYMEAYYGITATVNGKTLKVKAYNHSKDHAIISSKIISDLGDTKAIEIGYDEYSEIDCSNFANGLYAIETEFDTVTMQLYFYVNGEKIYVCKRSTRLDANLIEERRGKIQKLMDKQGLNLENSLQLNNITYPVYQDVDKRCDTDRYRELSHELLNGHTEWSDEFKLFVYTEWFVENIKYDFYRTDVLGHSRAKEYNIWSGEYSMLDLKVGVCSDFSNALLIMLREQGIPCNLVESKTHQWCTVYLNGRWYEHDLTGIMPYGSNEADASDVIDFGADYGYYASSEEIRDKIVTVNYHLYTERFSRYGYSKEPY